MKRTLIGICVGVVLAHILLEILLFSAGKVLLFAQERHNLKHATQGQNFKILCLGESTTMLGGEDSYPAQLEKILRHSLGPQITVINKGVAGIDSEYILRHAPEFLNTYHPDLVIVMMGINDTLFFDKSSLHPTFQQKFHDFVGQFKVVKFYKWLFSSFKPQTHPEDQANSTQESDLRPPQNLDELKASPQRDDPHVLYYMSGMLKYIQGDYAGAEEVMRVVIDQNFFPKWWKLMYQQLANCYLKEGKIREYIDTYHHIPYDSWEDLPFIQMCTNGALEPQIEGVIQDHIVQEPAQAAYYEFMADCLHLGNKPGEDTFRQKAKDIRERLINPYTQTNYLHLIDLLNAHHIPAIYMQYPMRSVNLLKSMLKDSKDYPHMVFVDNERIFKDAVQKEGFTTYFSDHFAGDFGHGTPKGNQLLAENAAQTVIELLKHRN